MGSLGGIIHCIENMFMLRASALDQKNSKMSALAQLHQAVTDDDVKQLNSLIKAGTDVNAIYNQEIAITRALDMSHTSSAEVILTAPKFNANAKNQFDRTPLFAAAKQGYSDFVRRLLDMNAKVDMPDCRGVTPLNASAWNDHAECADILISHGADVNKADIMGQTPIFRACSCVSINVARLLIKHGCDVNIPSKDGKSPLMEALPSYYSYKVAGKKISHMLEMCKMLIEAGSDVDYQDFNGKTALHHALDASNPFALCLLAENGARLEIKDNQGFTPFQSALAVRRPRYDAARFLLYYGADARQNIMTKEENGNVRTISPLSLVLKSKPNDMESKWSKSLLLRSLWAAVYPDGKMDEVADSSKIVDNELSFHEMIERDIIAWLNSCTPCTLQHQSRLAIRKQLHTKNILPKIHLLPIGTRLQRDLSLGLDTSKLPLSKICQLHVSILDSDSDKVKELIESGMDIHFPIDNKTPLALALEKGDDDISSTLLYTVKQKNLSDCVLNAEGDTLLHLAAKHGRVTVIDDTLDSFPDVNVKNALGYTALQEAVMAGHFDIAAKLIKKGADIAVSTTGDLPSLPIMHIASGSGAKELVELLLDMGVSPNGLDKFGNTPLHVAASKGSEYLRRHISLPSLYDDHGSANVDYVRMLMTGGNPSLAKQLPGHVTIANLLIEAGADVTKLNDNNMTPLMCAREARVTDMEEVFSKKDH